MSSTTVYLKIPQVKEVYETEVYLGMIADVHSSDRAAEAKAKAVKITSFSGKGKEAAFVGNVILKLYEGLAGTLVGAIKKGMMSTLRSKIGAALALPALKSTLKTFDASQYGGAPLLGLNGLVVKTHGSAKAKEVTNSIYQCVTFKEQDINGKIKKNILGSAEQEGM